MKRIQDNEFDSIFQKQYTGRTREIILSVTVESLVDEDVINTSFSMLGATVYTQLRQNLYWRLVNNNRGL